MIELVRMNQPEYDNFISLANKNYIEDQIRQGNWTEENSQEKMGEVIEQYLPAGFATPNHHFFMVVDPTNQAEVGRVWYFVTEREGQPQMFILYIYIEPPYRRQGYGMQVLEALEQHARQDQLTQISLSVFPHNTGARSLYQKAGFSFFNSDHFMVKQIAQA